MGSTQCIYLRKVNPQLQTNAQIVFQAPNLSTDDTFFQCKGIRCQLELVAIHIQLFSECSNCVLSTCDKWFRHVDTVFA